MAPQASTCRACWAVRKTCFAHKSMQNPSQVLTRYVRTGRDTPGVGNRHKGAEYVETYAACRANLLLVVRTAPLRRHPKIPKSMGCSGFGGQSRRNALLNWDTPLHCDYRAPSAIGSAIVRPHLALSCIHIQVGVLNWFLTTRDAAIVDSLLDCDWPLNREDF